MVRRGLGIRANECSENGCVAEAEDGECGC